MQNFICKDENVTDFLKSKAFDFDKRNVARTYLLVDQESVSSPAPLITAYFTLAIKALHFYDGASKTMIKDIDGFSKDAASVGSILIAQLGKDEASGTHLSGADILASALRIIYTIFDAAAGRIVFLECQPIEKLVAFYRKNQFKPLQTNARNGLLQMIRFL
jgi:hypothetical protein